MRLWLLLLLSLPAAAQEPPAESTATLHPCSRGYCGADKDGALAFWAAPDAEGAFEPGFETLRRQQSRYNNWARAQERSGRFPGLTLRDVRRGGWQGAGILAPSHLNEDGRLHPDTLMIPVYRDGAELLRLWSDWANDCRRSEYDETAPACVVSPGTVGPPPHHPILREREKTLQTGIAASREYARKVASLDALLVPIKDRYGRAGGSRLDFSRLPKDVLRELGVLQETVEASIDAGHRLAKRYLAEKDPLE